MSLKRVSRTDIIDMWISDNQAASEGLGLCEDGLYKCESVVGKLSIQVVSNTMDQMKSVSEGVFEGCLMGTTIEIIQPEDPDDYETG